MHSGLQRLARTAALAVAAAAVAAAPAVAQNASAPALAVGAGGTAHMAWIQAASDGSYVQERRRAPAGALTPKQWISLSETMAEAPRIGSDTAGNAIIAWTEYVPATNSTTGILTRRRAADGSLGPVQRVRPATGVRHKFDMAVNGAGDAVYAWTLATGTNSSVVQYRRRSKSGTMSATRTVSPTTGRVEAPRVTIDSSGTAVVAWVHTSPDGSNATVQARSVTATGGVGALQTIAASAATSSPYIADARDTYDVATAPDGRTAFAWKQPAGSGSNVNSRVRAADGTLSAAQPLTSSGSAFDPIVAIAPTGKVMYAWTTDKGTDPTVNARGRSPEGTLGATFTVEDGYQLSGLDVALDPKENAVFLSYSDRSGTGDFRLRVRRRTPTGVLSPSQDVSTPQAGVPTSGKLGVDANGYAVMMWEQYIDDGTSQSGRRVFARRQTPTGELSDIQTVSR
ncbi:MAG TPA: hypothetical protein VF533_05545 [Solirubrobacteraceae bacterium]|jgi:hypothetical protein